MTDGFKMRASKEKIIRTPPFTIKGISFEDDPVALNKMLTYELASKVHVATVKVKDVDVEGSIKRNARLGRPLDKEHSERIAYTLLETGVCLRMFAWWMPPDHRDNPSHGKRRMLDIPSGNHRFDGLTTHLDFTSVQFHIMDTEDEATIAGMRMTLNNITGIGNTPAMSLALAYQEATSHRISVKDKSAIEDLAERHNVSANVLGAHLVREAVRAVLIARGFKDAAAGLKIAHCKCLWHVLQGNKTVMAAAANVVHRVGMTAKATRDFVETIKDVDDDETAKLAKIQEIANQYAARTAALDENPSPKPRQRPTYVRFVESLRRVTNALEEKNPTEPKHMGITSREQMNEVRGLIRIITKHQAVIAPPEKKK